MIDKMYKTRMKYLLNLKTMNANSKKINVKTNKINNKTFKTQD